MVEQAPLVLALDQGTSGTTGLLVGLDGTIVRRSYRPVDVSYPQPGWVEQDANVLFDSVVGVARELLDGSTVAAIGITNQRETVVVFDRATLQPVAPAIVWQCRRSTGLCRTHRDAGHEPEVRRRTGLLLDPYFTATKLEWLFAQRPELLVRARRGELCAGTVDAWLIARLSGGARIATDASNASRTLLFDLNSGTWSPELCEMFSVPQSLLPEIVDSAGRIAQTDPAVIGAAIPISGIAGDQQAALFGQACIAPGMSKNTYGTGSFVVVNIGDRPVDPGHGLLSTVAWRLAGRTTFALEGSIFVTGAGIKWLRDSLNLIDDVTEVGPLFDSVPDTHGCYFVPALSGLGAPFWDPDARGALLGLSGGVTRAHVVRAVVEAMAYRTRDVVEAMENAASIRFDELRVDGGASVMDGFCQFQADLLGIPVARAASTETTALGAAMLAALGEGLIASIEDVAAQWQAGTRFAPVAPGSRPVEAYAKWCDAVTRVRSAMPEPVAV